MKNFKTILIALIYLLTSSILTAQDYPSIITNKTVDITFEGEPCLLKRSILSGILLPGKKVRKYVVSTERVNYYDMINTYTDTLGNTVIDTVQVLKVLSKKDKDVAVIYTNTEIDYLAVAIKDSIPNDISETEADFFKMQYGLLIGTQTDKPWGTKPEDWTLCND